MTETQQLPIAAWVLPTAAIVALLLVWLWYRHRNAAGSMQRLLSEISHEHLENVLLPNGDEGEIQIDHLLLTSRGLLVVDIKDVSGIVFGSDKMQDWTVIAAERRFTFPNPQSALYDRVAAVKQIVRQVPVEGRLLFPESAEFTKGVPGMVANSQSLQLDFGEADKTAARVKVDAFKPHWDQVRQAALKAEVGKMVSRRQA